MNQFIIFIICLCGLIVQSRCNTKNKGIDKPNPLPIFDMEKLDECPETHSCYCKFKIKIDTDGQYRNFDKCCQYNPNILHRALCVPKKYATDEEKMQYARRKLRQTMDLYNVSINEVEFLSCKIAKSYPTIIEFILEMALYGYHILVIASTWLEGRIERSNVNIMLKKTIQTFSLKQSISNIRELKHKNRHFEKLKAIEGIRTYNCLLIIWFHIRLALIVNYVQDTDYVEKAFSNRWIRYHFIFDLLLIQTFLMISGWLLIIKVLDIFEKSKQFTLKNDVLRLLLNRVLRYLPLIVFYYACTLKPVLQRVTASTNYEIIDVNSESCSNYWWSVFLFVSNNFIHGKLCLPITWYLSLDVQVYLISLIVLYIIMKFHLPIKRSLCMVLAMSYVIHALMIYINDTDVGFKVGPESSQIQVVMYDKNHLLLYHNTLSNMSSYIVGLMAGVFYYENKDRVINNKICKILWAILFIGLPSLSIYLGSHEYASPLTAMLGPLLKPLYASGIAVGILGLTHNFGGIVKRICEWQPAIFVSKFTLCVYLFHGHIIFFKNVTITGPMPVSNVAILASVLIELPISFAFGVWNYLILEVPMTKIIGNVLPKINNKTSKVTNID